MSQKSNKLNNIEKKTKENKVTIQPASRGSRVASNKKNVKTFVNNSGSGFYIKVGDDVLWIDTNNYNQQFNELLISLNELLDILGSDGASGSEAFNLDLPLEPTKINPTANLKNKIDEVRQKVTDVKNNLH